MLLCLDWGTLPMKYKRLDWHDGLVAFRVQELLDGYEYDKPAHLVPLW